MQEAHLGSRCYRDVVEGSTMDISMAPAHHSIYVNYSVLVLLLYPLLLIPLLRRRGAWGTAAPLLLVLLPLFHGTTLAYVELRWMFGGMAVGGRTGGGSVAVGLASPHEVLMIGAAFSGMALLVAGIVAIWRARRDSGTASARMRGRWIAATIVGLALLLILGVAELAHGGFHADLHGSVRIYPFVTGGAYASGALTVAAIVASWWLIRRSAAQPDAQSAGRYWSTLVIALLVIAAVGWGAWMVRGTFLRIASYGD
jgi:hypothetical protein